MASIYSSNKKNSSKIVHLSDHLASSSAAEVNYKRLELLLIGFASIVITFLWVGVFSTVFQNRQVRLSFLGEGDVAGIVRDGFSQAQIIARGAIEAGTMAKQTISYQFTAIYESSCLLQGKCNGQVDFVAFKVKGIFASLQNMTNHMHRVVAAAQDILSLRLIDAGSSVAVLFSPEKAYASPVLGEKIVSPEMLMQNGVHSYFRSINAITFGAVSVVNPYLTGSNR